MSHHKLIVLVTACLLAAVATNMAWAGEESTEWPTQTQPAAAVAPAFNAECQPPTTMPVVVEGPPGPKGDTGISGLNGRDGRDGRDGATRVVKEVVIRNGRPVVIYRTTPAKDKYEKSSVAARQEQWNAISYAQWSADQANAWIWRFTHPITAPDSVNGEKENTMTIDPMWLVIVAVLGIAALVWALRPRQNNNTTANAVANGTGTTVPVLVIDRNQLGGNTQLATNNTETPAQPAPSTISEVLDSFRAGDGTVTGLPSFKYNRYEAGGKVGESLTYAPAAPYSNDDILIDTPGQAIVRKGIGEVTGHKQPGAPEVLQVEVSGNSRVDHVHTGKVEGGEFNLRCPEALRGVLELTGLAVQPTPAPRRAETPPAAPPAQPAAAVATPTPPPAARETAPSEEPPPTDLPKEVWDAAWGTLLAGAHDRGLWLNKSHRAIKGGVGRVAFAIAGQRNETVDEAASAALDNAVEQGATRPFNNDTNDKVDIPADVWPDAWKEFNSAAKRAKVELTKGHDSVNKGAARIAYALIGQPKVPGETPKQAADAAVARALEEGGATPKESVSHTSGPADETPAGETASRKAGLGDIKDAAEILAKAYKAKGLQLTGGALQASAKSLHNTANGSIEKMQKLAAAKAAEKAEAAAAAGGKTAASRAKGAAEENEES